MQVRPITEADVEELKVIHKRFYEHEFSFEDFISNFYASCIIANGDEQIVVAGGIRPLIEIVAVTNKDLSVRTRKEALYKFLQVAMQSSQGEGLHAFIQDETWEKHLKRFGFTETVGKSLVLKRF